MINPSMLRPVDILGKSEKIIVDNFSAKIKGGGSLLEKDIELLNAIVYINSGNVSFLPTKLKEYLTLETLEKLLSKYRLYNMITYNNLKKYSETLVPMCLGNFTRFAECNNKNSKNMKYFLTEVFNDNSHIQNITNAIFSNQQYIILKYLKPDSFLWDFILINMEQFCSDQYISLGMGALKRIKLLSITSPNHVQLELIKLNEKVFGLLYEPSTEAKTLHKVLWEV